MNIDWQNVVTLGLVIVAACYVVRRLWRTAGGKRPAGCPACSDCPDAHARKPLVSIDRTPKPNAGEREDP